MKLLLVINVADDIAEDYKNFTVDYDLRGEDEDGDNVSIKYVEDRTLKSMPSRKSNQESVMVGSLQMDLGYILGWNECLDEIEND